MPAAAAQRKYNLPPHPVPHLHLSLGRRVMEKTKKEAGRG